MKINLKGLALKASVGIYEHEKLLTTKVIISAEVFIKTTTSFDENAIIDYKNKRNCTCTPLWLH